MSDQPVAQDSAGVKVPPPLIFLGILAILAGFDRLAWAAPCPSHRYGAICSAACA